jgi:glycosyltransferase involved in cell wall biosynthesis
MTKVSVIIPAYNRAHLLPECLESVLAQSFQDFEIIVVDDGSTDNTHEIVSTFPAKYAWQENQGPPGARNRGIELAHGEYVAFLDSDDALLQDALEKGVEVLDKHPEAAFSHGQAYLMDENSRIYGLTSPHLKYSSVRDGREEITDYLIFGNHVTSSTVMFRRSCLDEVGRCNPAFRSGSVDLDLWLRLAKRYAVAYIAEPLAKFRSHSGSFCGGRNLSEWEQTNSSILESIFNDVDLGPLFSHLRPIAYYRLYFALAARACTRGDTKTARYYLYKALKTRPTDFFRRRGLRWLIQFAETWVPQPALSLARNTKRCVGGTVLARHT